MNVSAEQQATVIRARWVRIVDALLPLSPAARAYVRARGDLGSLAPLTLRVLASKLRRERPYLPAGMRHGVCCIEEAIDKELDRRGGPADDMDRADGLGG